MHASDTNDDDDDAWFDSHNDDGRSSWLSRACVRQSLCTLALIACVVTCILIAFSSYYMFRANYRAARMRNGKAVRFLQTWPGLCDMEGNEADYTEFHRCAEARTVQDKSTMWIAVEMTMVDARDILVPEANYKNVALFVISLFFLLSTAALAMFVWLACGGASCVRGNNGGSSTYYITQPAPAPAAPQKHHREKGVEMADGWIQFH